MTIKKKQITLLSILAALPVIFIIILYLYIKVNTLSIFPSEKYSAIGWWPHGNEKSSIEITKPIQKKIGFEFTLEGSPAYAGISIFLDQNYPFLDLSKYRTATIKISAPGTKHFGFIIRTFEKGITQLKESHYSPLRSCEIKTTVSKDQKRYSISLSKLKAPDWWIASYALPGKELDPNPLKNSVILQIFFDDAELLGQKNKIEVDEIAFHSSPPSLWPIAGAGMVCYYILFISFLVFARIKRKVENNHEKLLFTYKKISQQNNWKSDTDKVRTCISEHYNNPEISLQFVSTMAGMSQQRVKEIMNREYAMNFKSCILWLRLQEAKRLLIETDLNITEIAFSLGFNSNSYFGLTFKKHEKVTPKIYRQKKRQLRRD